MRNTRFLVLLAMLAAVVACSGCAILHEENRRLLNMLDEGVADTVVTESTAGKVLFAPIYVPMAVIAGVLDAVIVNPSFAAPVAVVDTRKMLWEAQHDSEVRRAMMFVPKVVATPVVFLGHWAFYTLVPTSYGYQVPGQEP